MKNKSLEELLEERIKDDISGELARVKDAVTFSMKSLTRVKPDMSAIFDAIDLVIEKEYQGIFDSRMKEKRIALMLQLGIHK